MKRILLTALAVATLGLTVNPNAVAIQPLNFREITGGQLSASLRLAAAATNFVTVEQDHATAGTAQIVQEDGATYLVFDDAFDTARGPDVQVVLYTDATAPVHLAEGSYAIVGTLQSFEGAQRYLIPADIDVAAYASIAIWCREFNVTFGYAPL